MLVKCVRCVWWGVLDVLGFGGLWWVIKVVNFYHFSDVVMV